MPFKRLPLREIHTLDPNQFIQKSQKWIDLSYISNPTIRIFSSKQQSDKPVQLPYASDHRVRDLWPPNAQGFLYYASPPKDRPRISGELRFRLTTCNDPAQFNSGQDLPLLTAQHHHHQQPWKRPIYSIATSSLMAPLYEKLLEESLVSPDLDANIKALPKLTFMYSRCQIIHALNDPFVLDLASDWQTLVVVSESGIENIHMLRMFRDMRIGMTPYTGTVLARFERSPLIDHEGTRTVVLRILNELITSNNDNSKVIKCLIPSYDEYIQRPTPGYLFAKRFHGKLRPWSVDIDKPDKAKVAAVGLRLLWECDAQSRR